jgi:hypothetical protein
MKVNYILNNSVTISLPDTSVIQQNEFLSMRDRFCDITNNNNPNNNEIKLPFSSFPQH